MDVKHDLDYMVEFMVKLLKTPSPTGDTIKALNLVEEEFAKYGLKAVSYTHLTLPTICSV